MGWEGHHLYVYTRNRNIIFGWFMYTIEYPSCRKLYAKDGIFGKSFSLLLQSDIYRNRKAEKSNQLHRYFSSLKWLYVLAYGVLYVWTVFCHTVLTDCHILLVEMKASHKPDTLQLLGLGLPPRATWFNFIITLYEGIANRANLNPALRHNCSNPPSRECRCLMKKPRGCGPFVLGLSPTVHCKRSYYYLFTYVCDPFHVDK